MSANAKFHIEARISFLTAEEGGRKTPARSGYRPQFHYEGQDWVAMQEYIDKEEAYPGDTVTTRLSFLSPEEHRGRLRPGMEFQIREGQRVVANGVVTKILDL
jgi:translation elongation factor EF-Tu-like GTPase